MYPAQGGHIPVFIESEFSRLFAKEFMVANFIFIEELAEEKGGRKQNSNSVYAISAKISQLEKVCLKRG
jgi:hypothetical protein